MLALLLTTARAASAQGSDAATARTLFNQGQQDMRDARTDEACAKFAEAQRLDANVGYLVNLARCNEKRDRLADALESWLKAVDLAKVRNDARLPDVQNGLDALSSKVPRVVIRMAQTPPAGMQLQRDDVALTPASLDIALPLNPGRHVITARAAGYEPWTITITVRSGDAPMTVDVPALSAEARPPSSASAPAEPSDGGSSRGSTQRVLGVVSGGLGIAAGAVGTFFALRASSLNDKSSTGCDAANACLPESLKQRNDALSAADISTGSFIVAGVLVVTGVVLYLTAPSGNPRTSSSAMTTGFRF